MLNEEYVQEHGPEQQSSRSGRVDIREAPPEDSQAQEGFIDQETGPQDRR
jgi:hypothetical protein